jgi:RNA polymerase primary sigma factor
MCKDGGKMKKPEQEGDDDVIHSYFSQIKAIPLLSFEEEQELSRRIQKKDDAALRKLIESNLKLVVKIARSYISQDVPFLDIIQEGNLGLMRAAEKFDHKKNVRFSTYASWWIRQSISRYLSNKRRPIRLPQRKEEILKKVQCSYHTLSQTLMRQPNTGEISQEIGVSTEDINSVISLTKGTFSIHPGPGEETSMDFYEDYTYNPERALLKKSSRDETIRFLGHLKDRERRIVMYRYRFDGGKRYTLKKISEKMGISPETVRQIEMKAMQKMRLRADELRNCVYAI